MPAQEKRSHLPGIKLSQNIRKAIEKNVGCEEDLIKTLQDVEIKKRAALNEILSKKSAFLGQQRRRRESLPDVLGRNGENHHLILNRKKVSDDLKFSSGTHSFTARDKDAMLCRSTFKLPSLSTSTVRNTIQIESGNGEEICELSESQDSNGKTGNTVNHSQEVSSMQSVNERNAESERNAMLTESSGVESVLGAHSWPPSSHVHLEQKSILKRRNSVADIVHSNNRAGWSESITRPAWLRRQSLYQVTFCSQTTPQTTSSISDPSLLQSNAEFVLEDSTLSRYRKVLNRRRSLQAPVFNRSSILPNGGLPEGNVDSFQDCHFHSPKNQDRRRVSFQDSSSSV